MTTIDRDRQNSLSYPTSPRRPSSGQFSFKGSLYVAHNEKDWIEIQKNTFTNWCNVLIEPYGVQITGDLAEAFADGTLLVYLVESISTKKVGRYNKNPKLYAQKLENITAALKLLESDGIKLVNIGKVLLGVTICDRHLLSYFLTLFYRLTLSKHNGAMLIIIEKSTKG